ncbi:cytochrome P450 [Amycolatopsis sp. cg13]|uniref:cytochrome P450 family protein n=1 Tax=Amycolatopsis sp. cg13 TaxID=3238807 RepID=UPI00352444B4
MTGAWTQDSEDSMADTGAFARTELAGADFQGDPHKYYRQWREDGPVRHVQLPAGFACWVVTGYEEGREALADPRLRKDSSRFHEVLRRQSPDAAMTTMPDIAVHMLNSDPPDHTRLRKLVNKTFTSRRVAAMRPRIEEITSGFLDEMDTRAEVDLLRAFANPLPVAVICELLGIPFEDRADFQARTRLMLSDVSSNTVEERSTTAEVMTRYLQQLIEAKRGEPGEDLLSALVRAHDDGDRLTERELVGMAFLLLVAGHETMVNLIGNGVHALLRNPAQFEALRADLSRVPNAVEEFLRYEGPVRWSTARYTAEPVRIGDTDIPAGEIVYVAVGAMNRDPDHFHDPETLLIDRDASGHLAFGHGIHNCVGTPLARLEADIAFTELLRRFPKLALADEAFTAQWRDGLLVHGLRELPVRLHG